MNTPTTRQTMNGKPVFTVPAKTVINFKSGFAHKLLCDGPTFTAGTSCAYSCSFCFVPSAMKKQEKWLKDHGVEGSHEDVVIRRTNAIEIARKQLESHKLSERQKQKVIYASPLVDVAANMEFVRETVEICKVILELTNWDIRLLSKSNLLPKIAVALQAHPGPFANFADSISPRNRIIYGVSTGTLDDNLAAAFEEGTPKVSKRIESLHWLQDNGFRTFGMICPSLPQWDYPKFALNMANALRAEKLEHCWAEVINVRGESFERTEKCLRDAGFGGEAAALRAVSTDKNAWEQYARSTFDSQWRYYGDKFRFLQYVNKHTLPYWQAQKENGAVLL